MDPMTAFLLAMQAAGMVASAAGAKSQQKFIKLGRQLEKAQFETNLEAIRLQSADASLDQMKQVRQNIGSQIVANAAKGNRGGSSYSRINQTVSALSKDERTRRMNLLARESELRAGHVLSGLHTAQAESQLGQALMKDLINKIPVSATADRLMSPGPKASNSASANTGGNFSWGF